MQGRGNRVTIQGEAPIVVHGVQPHSRGQHVRLFFTLLQDDQPEDGPAVLHAAQVPTQGLHILKAQSPIADHNVHSRDICYKADFNPQRPAVGKLLKISGHRGRNARGTRGCLLTKLVWRSKHISNPCDALPLYV